MERFKASLGLIFTVVVYMIAGAECGRQAVRLGLPNIAVTNTEIDLALTVFILLLVLYAAIFFHIIIHEGGHYICGKISGYKLSSFRIGSLMFIKKNNKTELKRYKLVGTGGQCLMIPPSCRDSCYSFPYALYNLGGIIANIFFSTIAIMLYVLLESRGIVPVFLCTFAIIGFTVAILNGVPMKIGGVANDGYNVLSLGKDAEARRALWLQLAINGRMTEGQRLKDMPQEWFELPEDADMSNPLVCACAVFKGNRCHDQLDFKSAQELYKKLLEDTAGMLEIYKNEVRCELMFYEIIGQSRKDEIDRLYTKKLRKYIKATSSYISRQRLMYACELLINKNQQEADKRLKAFEKACSKYPYSAEIESEREIIAYIQQKAEEQIEVKSEN